MNNCSTGVTSSQFFLREFSAEHGNKTMEENIMIIFRLTYQIAVTLCVSLKFNEGIDKFQYSNFVLTEIISMMRFVAISQIRKRFILQFI